MLFLKISQYSQENICAGAFLNKVAGFLKMTPAQVFSCENCKIFKNPYVFKNTIPRHINALFSSSFNSCTMN